MKNKVLVTAMESIRVTSPLRFPAEVAIELAELDWEYNAPGYDVQVLIDLQKAVQIGSKVGNLKLPYELVGVLSMHGRSRPTKRRKIPATKTSPEMKFGRMLDCIPKSPTNVLAVYVAMQKTMARGETLAGVVPFATTEDGQFLVYGTDHTRDEMFIAAWHPETNKLTFIVSGLGNNLERFLASLV